MAATTYHTIISQIPSLAIDPHGTLSARAPHTHTHMNTHT
jgi:hypothetical protein